MNGSTFPPRTLSIEDTLKRRFQEGRYNGRCFGKVICVDNLGQSYDEDKIRTQLMKLLPGVVDVRFSGLDLKGVRYQWGWCVIELSSREAAVKSLCVLDRTCLRIGQDSMWRPLIAHFPNWEVPPIDLELAAKYESSAISLHLGQPSNMDRLSWEFIELESVLHKTKQNLVQKTVEKLKPHLNNPQSASMDRKREPRGDSQTIWLKNVSLDVTQDQLIPLFKCFDEAAMVERIVDSIKGNATNDVLVSFSTKQKTKHVLQDLQTLMLLSRSVLPITASLFDPVQHLGFESVFDLALEATGWKLDNCAITNEVVFKDKEEESVKQMRSVMDEMQHQRIAFNTLKHQQRVQLAQRLSNEVEIVQQKFNRINDLLKTANALID